LMLRFIGVSRCPTVLLALCYSSQGTQYFAEFRSTGSN
jgi:hypothetical protein